MTDKATIAIKVISQIENNPLLMQQILSALKLNRAIVLGELNHPVASFTITALEEWHKTNDRQIQH